MEPFKECRADIVTRCPEGHQESLNIEVNTAATTDEDNEPITLYEYRFVVTTYADSDWSPETLLFEIAAELAGVDTEDEDSDEGEDESE